MSLGAGCGCNACVCCSCDQQSQDSNKDSNHPRKICWAPRSSSRKGKTQDLEFLTSRNVVALEDRPSQPPCLVCLPESSSDGNDPCCSFRIYLEVAVCRYGCLLAHFISTCRLAETQYLLLSFILNLNFIGFGEQTEITICRKQWVQNTKYLWRKKQVRHQQTASNNRGKRSWPWRTLIKLHTK